MLFGGRCTVGSTPELAQRDTKEVFDEEAKPVLIRLDSIVLREFYRGGRVRRGGAVSPDQGDPDRRRGGMGLPVRRRLRPTAVRHACQHGRGGGSGGKMLRFLKE